MKFFTTAALIALSIATFSQESSAYEASCVITGTEPTIYFKQATTQNDQEYYSIETATHQGVTFFLKAGHGVARLEAFINKKRTATTFYSYGRDPSETDSLRLEVLAANGKYIEAQCDGIDSRLP